MKFIKMHGLGNDFVILDQRRGEDGRSPDRESFKSGREEITPAQASLFTDRHKGVGCDQLIVMEPSDNADLYMRIYNSDGSQAEACGNATRCVAHLYMQGQGVQECTIETVAGLLPSRMVDDLVEVDMGEPISVEDLDLSVADANDPVAVNMGNPHCVFFVDNAEDVNIESFGPSVENHTTFPDRTNVEFVSVKDDGSLRLRVWERGAGVTLACGSGACATAVAAVHRGVSGRNVDIEMDGGVLTLEYRESDNHVLMTGPVAYVFEGELKA